MNLPASIRFLIDWIDHKWVFVSPEMIIYWPLLIRSMFFFFILKFFVTKINKEEAWNCAVSKFFHLILRHIHFIWSHFKCPFVCSHWLYTFFINYNKRIIILLCLFINIRKFISFFYSMENTTKLKCSNFYLFYAKINKKLLNTNGNNHFILIFPTHFILFFFGFTSVNTFYIGIYNLNGTSHR